MKLRLLLGVGVVLALGVMGSAALAGGPHAGTTCSGGAPGSPTPIPAGTYQGLVVTGICTFTGDKVKINGNLTVSDGAILNDHAGSTTQVHVTGDVIVGAGAVLGLGTYNPQATHKSEVGGSILATGPQSLYVSFVRIRGDLISSGGGTDEELRNFPIKDNRVDGNLSVTGWDGFWVGLIRNSVGGTVTFSDNTGINPDSSEVQTNVIRGNLVCENNTPPAVVNGEDGGELNVVGGHALGECAGLVS